MYALFGKIVAVLGGACALMALMTNSVVPLVLGTVALFATLSFINGLGDRDVRRTRSYAR